MRRSIINLSTSFWVRRSPHRLEYAISSSPADRVRSGGLALRWERISSGLGGLSCAKRRWTIVCLTASGLDDCRMIGFLETVNVNGQHYIICCLHQHPPS